MRHMKRERERIRFSVLYNVNINILSGLHFRIFDVTIAPNTKVSNTEKTDLRVNGYTRDAPRLLNVLL